jgi:hypothetical protein
VVIVALVAGTVALRCAGGEGVQQVARTYDHQLSRKPGIRDKKPVFCDIIHRCLRLRSPSRVRGCTLLENLQIMDAKWLLSAFRQEPLSKSRATGRAAYRCRGRPSDVFSHPASAAYADLSTSQSPTH